MTKPHDPQVTAFKDVRPGKGGNKSDKLEFCNICKNCDAVGGKRKEGHHKHVGRTKEKPKNVLKTFYSPNEVINDLA